MRQFLIGLAMMLPCVAVVPAQAAPFGYAADGDTSAPSPFYRIDFATNTITQIGTTSVRMEGLAFGPGAAVLYGISDGTDSLYTVSTVNGAVTLVGSLGVSISNPGMVFCPDNQTMYFSETGGNGRLYRVNLATGEATLVGESTSLPFTPQGLSCSPTGVLHAVTSSTRGNAPGDSLYRVNRSTGEATLVGPLGVDISTSGMGDLGNRILLVTDRGPTILYEVNRFTGAATAVATLSPDELNLEALAIDAEAAPPPPAPVPTLSEWVMLFLASLLGIFGFRRLRRA